MTNPMSTLDRLANVLTSRLHVDGSRVTPGARINELGLDSLELVDLQMELEIEFGIDIDESSPVFQYVGTLSELVEAIDKQTAMRAA